MADGAAATAPGGDVPAIKPGNRKMLIAGVVGTLVALGGGGYYYQSHAHKPVAQDAKQSDKTARKPMVYLPLDTFTVNLRETVQERYLQVTINLELLDATVVESLKQQMPSVRNRILLILSSKTADDLLPREGKEKLALELSAELRKTLDGADANKGLEQVLFTHFVIQ